MLGDDHGDDQRDSRKHSEQAANDQSAADNLDSADKRPHYRGMRDADIGKASCTQNLRKSQLLNAFRKKNDKTDEKSDKNMALSSLLCAASRHLGRSRSTTTPAGSVLI